jgi:RimJ/RimL family protein N-acetyltransferase
MPGLKKIQPPQSFRQTKSAAIRTHVVHPSVARPTHCEISTEMLGFIGASLVRPREYPYSACMFAYNAFVDNPFRAVAHLWRDRLSAYRRDRAAGYHAWKARWRMMSGFHPATTLLVPIRSLNPWHKRRILAHLLALSSEDRYLRFGYSAKDEQITNYVKSIDFKRDDVFGIYDRKLELVAMAHLARSEDVEHKACAEFGVSVLASARGRGYGTHLFDRAVMHARNHGVQVLFVHALSENTAMLKIARKAGASVVRDGSESNAYLQLPPADVNGMVGEMLEERLAQTDYWLKQQANDFQRWLAVLQHRRFGAPLPPLVEKKPDTPASKN